MKSVALLVLVLATTLADATEIDADVSAELRDRKQKEIEQYIYEIKHLQGEALINSADIISGSGVSDDDLYQAVEQKVEHLFRQHLENERDRIRDNEINALIRTLASLDGEKSYRILLDIKGSTKSRGLRNRAHRLLPKLIWYSNRNRLMQKTDYYEPGQQLMTHRYLNLIASDDMYMRRYGAEEINRRQDAEPIVFRKMAEILEKEKYEIGNDIQLDALAWYCRVLRDYGGDEYTTLLQSIADDGQAHKKLRKYAR